MGNSRKAWVVRFSRDYTRMLGVPPSRDVGRLASRTARSWKQNGLFSPGGGACPASTTQLILVSQAFLTAATREDPPSSIVAFKPYVELPCVHRSDPAGLIVAGMGGKAQVVTVHHIPRRCSTMCLQRIKQRVELSDPVSERLHHQGCRGGALRCDERGASFVQNGTSMLDNPVSGGSERVGRQVRRVASRKTGRSGAAARAGKPVSINAMTPVVPRSTRRRGGT